MQVRADVEPHSDPVLRPVWKTRPTRLRQGFGEAGPITSDPTSDPVSPSRDLSPPVENRYVPLNSSREPRPRRKQQTDRSGGPLCPVLDDQLPTAEIELRARAGSGACPRAEPSASHSRGAAMRLPLGERSAPPLR